MVKIQTQKGSNERVIILTRAHGMQISGEIPFIKPQNDTEPTDKRSKTMKNERKRLILFWFSFYSLFGVWKIVLLLSVPVRSSFAVPKGC